MADSLSSVAATDETSDTAQVLLPFQTDPLLSSLYRTPKPHRPTSPTRQNSNAPSLNGISTYRIDVRTVALLSFRDKIILPLSTRLRARLSMLNKEDSFSETTAYQQPRLQQMCVLSLSILPSFSSYLQALQATRPRLAEPPTTTCILPDRTSPPTNPQ